MLLFAMLAALPTAHAQAAAELVAGEPDFTDCLGSESCEANFYAFLSESMAEQGFAMQWDPVSTSAAVRPGGGLVVGGRLIAGWRGRTAALWTIGSFGLLALAYFGTRLMLEVFLVRG